MSATTGILTAWPTLPSVSPSRKIMSMSLSTACARSCAARHTALLVPLRRGRRPRRPALPRSLFPSVGATLAVARGRGRAPPLRTTRKSTAPHAKNLSLRSQCAHRLWQSVLPCGDNLFGAPHSLYRAGRTESSAPYGYTIGGVQWGGGLWSARPTDGLVAGEGGPMWASAPTK